MNRCWYLWVGAALVFVLQLGLAGVSLGAPQVLPIDVTTTSVQGQFLLDGSPYPTDDVATSTYETAVFDLASEAGQPIPLGDNDAMAYGPLPIIFGDYTPIFTGLGSDSGLAPVVGPTPLAGPVAITSPTILDIDVPAIFVTFELTLDGVPFPHTGSDPFEEEAYYALRHVSTGNEIPLGSSVDAPLSARIVPGTYDVIYRHSTGNPIGLPKNENAVVAHDLVLSTSETVIIDAPTVELPISFLLNGAPFPTPFPAGDGRLDLRNFETGDRVSYGSTSEGPTSRTIIKGTYDATWTRTGNSYLVPVNGVAVVEEGLDIQTPAPRVVDVQAVTITPTPLLDGALFPVSNEDRGSIWLVNGLGDVINLGTTQVPSTGEFIVAGTYDAWYGVIQSTGTAPINPSARIASGLVLTTDQTLPLDVPTADVALTYTLDGGPLPVDQSEPLIYRRCSFTLIGEGEGNTIDLGQNVDPPIDWLRVVAGSYDVVYDWQTGDLLPTNTGHRVIENAALSAAVSLPVALLSEEVSPSFLLDGLPFPTDPFGHGPEHGHVYLTQPSGGEVSLGASDEVAPETVLAIEGPYDVEWEWTQGTTVPRNPRQRVGPKVFVPEPAVSPSLVIGSVFVWLLFRHRRGRRSAG